MPGSSVSVLSQHTVGPSEGKGQGHSGQFMKCLNCDNLPGFNIMYEGGF